jgi:two-component system cell cycle response regulator
MPQSVLIVDDAQEIHDLIAVRLRPEGVTLHHALDAATGLVIAEQQGPDLVLLDLDLQGISGLEVCRQLKSLPVTAPIPVIMLTGTTDTATKVMAFDLGAVDYVTKPFDAVELRARVRSALRTKRYQDLLATSAQLDAMTALWNRTYFDARLGDELAAARRHAQPLALAMVDVDHFKRINDTYGHPFGDEALRQVAQALLRSVRRTDVVCRYGGEEFGIILRGTGDEASQRAAERMRESIAALSLSHRDEPVPITASVGVAASDDVAREPGLTGLGLVLAADHALYRAKHAGRNQVVRASLDRSDLSTGPIARVGPAADPP